MNIGNAVKVVDTVVKVTTLSMLAAKAAMIGLIMYSDHQKNKASV